MFKPQVILHPTDLTSSSHPAFHVALDLARQHGSRLVLLHVAAPPGPEQVSYGEAASEPQPAAYYAKLMRQMADAFGPEAVGVTPEYLVREGPVPAAIEQAARDLRCDLIVVGTHEAGALVRLLLGSTAEHIIRISPCPVLVVKESLPLDEAGGI